MKKPEDKGTKGKKKSAVDGSKKNKAEKSRAKAAKEAGPEFDSDGLRVEGFIESFSDDSRINSPVLEPTREEQSTGDLEDFLGAETAAGNGRSSREKEDKETGPSYFASEPPYSSEQRTASQSFESMHEESFNEIVNKLRGKNILIEKSSMFSDSKSLFEMDKPRNLEPVRMPEAAAGMSEDYVLKYAKPHDAKEALPWVKKESVDLKKYKRAK